MSLKESETLELKTSTSELKEALESISAILNKHGQGELYFGIGKDGVVLGQDVTEKTIRDISQAISEKIEPKIYPIIEEKIIDEKHCIFVSFHGKAAPYFAFGRAYMRVGDSDRQMSQVELESLFVRKNRDKLSWEIQTSDCNISDIDAKTVCMFVKKANEAGRIDFKFKNTETTLRKLGLMKENTLLNAATALFSQKNPLKVQAAVFAGTDKLTFLDIRQFEGNIFELLQKSEDYLKEKMNWRVKFGKLEREEIPEIPIKALREALVNSLCHRDYTPSGDNYVAVFKDRIEIDNPGTFPENLEPEDFIHREEQSVLRNPLIADILFRTKDIEKWGSGLRRIYEECEKNKVKVEFRRTKTGFKVIFYRKEGADSYYPKTSSKLAQNYPENVVHILEAISGNPHTSLEELMKLSSLSKSGVKHILNKLKKDGVIKRVGGSRGGHWEIIS